MVKMSAKEKLATFFAARKPDGDTSDDDDDELDLEAVRQERLRRQRAEREHQRRSVWHRPSDLPVPKGVKYVEYGDNYATYYLSESFDVEHESITVYADENRKSGQIEKKKRR